MTFDGIQKNKVEKKIVPRLVSRTFEKRGLSVDGLRAGTALRRVPMLAKTNIRAKAPHHKKAQVRHQSRVKNPYYSFSHFKLPAIFTAVVLFLGIGVGMVVALHTGKTNADTAAPQVLGASTTIPLPDAKVVYNNSNVSNQDLFNVPIEQLQSYLTPPPSQADILAAREYSIVSLLKQYHSPLLGDTDTIAEQPHWKILLAIAFAESTLGKNCADFNCSNIGVKPGNPIWHQYDNYKEWIVDFNGLLDRRYKDQTLQQMCGVYVQPCNPNWLLATQEILDQLKDVQ